jgi:uncharacterized protein with GYD domain
MPHYLVRFQYSSDSVKKLVAHPQDREAAGRKLVEGFGGKLHSYFFALGDFDGLGLCEFPDHVAATAFSMSLAVTGGFSKIETTPLLTSAEAQAAMKRANETKTDYRSPNA